ncbi:hypothetical protein FRUB_01870 [Fimbriiglobus ruber]|uniref:Tyr recombinase domain-containing protein n=2 Tax=Fimbriiglobus ruber TaxID=1908690 RepID=A0A225E7Q0_9BACT|nr:hypothetical protein FRUB_01870 [Fimbriiglobus ruber]
MPRAILMSWDAGHRRWQKMFRGTMYRVTCAQLGLHESKWSKELSYQTANTWWEAKRASLESETVAAHPHRARLDELARMRDASRAAGEHSDADEIADEMKRVEVAEPDDVVDATHDALMRALLTAFESGIDVHKLDTRKIAEMFGGETVWRDRAKRSSVVPVETSVEGYATRWVGDRRDEAIAGVRSNESADSLRRHLSVFVQFVGSANAVEVITADVWHRWYVHCAGQVVKRDASRAAGWSPDTASKIFGIARTFVRWLWERDAIAALPKNLNDKKHRFERPERTIPTFTNDEIRSMLGAARGVHRLLLLLMLNTGATQKDVADLLKTEVDLEAGRITRRRSKMSKRKAGRLVSYKLWPEVVSLLREYTNTDESEVRALTTKSGQPWVWTETTDAGKMRKSDNVATVFNTLKRKINVSAAGKSLKVFRKTSATRLKSNPVHRDLRFLFLGHSERSIADRHYAAADQSQLDAAVDWLLTQYGV